MANELTLNASLAYSDSELTADSLAGTANLQITVATKRITHEKVSIPTSEVVIDLGGCASPGFGIFINRDPTNFIELRVATGGAKFAKLKPGEYCMLRLGSGAQVPFAIADTAACQMEYLICAT